MKYATRGRTRAVAPSCAGSTCRRSQPTKGRVGGGSSVGCSPALRRPSPYGRRVGSSEKLSRPAQGSRVLFGLRTCTSGAPRISPEASAGRSLVSTAPVATGRTDNSQGGNSTRWPSRPRRSLHNLLSAHVRPPFVPHCQPIPGRSSPPFSRTGPGDPAGATSVPPSGIGGQLSRDLAGVMGGRGEEGAFSIVTVSARLRRQASVRQRIANP